MAKSKSENISEVRVYILDGCKSDITKFDFSVFNIQVVKFKSDKAKELIDKHLSIASGISLYTSLQWDEKKWSDPFILLPIDINKVKEPAEGLNVYWILSILFPSDLQIVSTVFLTKREDGLYLNYTRLTEFDYTGDYKESNYLVYNDDDIDIGEINHFILLFQERFQNLTFLNITFQAYLSAIYDRNPKMAFLNYCIGLESLMINDREINYRIARGIAVLCSSNKTDGEIIYKNVKSLYTLRSAIAHGRDLKKMYKAVTPYTIYLRLIIARSIIEAILINLQPVKLDLEITKHGFGESANLNSESYHPLNLNKDVLKKIRSLSLRDDIEPKIT